MSTQTVEIEKQEQNGRNRIEVKQVRCQRTGYEKTIKQATPETKNEKTKQRTKKKTEKW